MDTIFSKEEIEPIIQKYVKFTSGAKVIYAEKFKLLRNMEIKNDDIFLLGFPKSGTTWAQELVWLIANDLDMEKAKIFIDERFPNIELECFDLSASNPNMVQHECHKNSIEFAQNMKSPRFIKSHLDLDMLPKQLFTSESNFKIIYVSRNIKDTCVSSYYYGKDLLNSFDGSLEEYTKLFIFQLDTAFNNYWGTLLYFWNHRHDKNILFLRYEELKTDLRQSIQKVATFFEKELTEEDETKLIEWLQFDSMKNNAALNHHMTFNKSGFIRVGRTGEHKKEMSPELIEKFDIWIKENLKDTDYVNDYQNIKE